MTPLARMATMAGRVVMGEKVVILGRVVNEACSVLNIIYVIRV